jgi:2-iminobutanoate/2-iminopropanoate deaminase
MSADSAPNIRESTSPLGDDKLETDVVSRTMKAPTSDVTRFAGTVYVGIAAHLQTGEVVDAPVERQTERVLEQMKRRLDTSGSLAHVLKCKVYCTSVDTFAAVNAVYAGYFPTDPQARAVVSVSAWPGYFDIDIDCIAAVDSIDVQGG